MVARDRDAAWAAISAATVDDSKRATAFENWRRYAQACNLDPWMRGTPRYTQQEYLLAFAARVRTGLFGHGLQVGFQSVETALRHMAQTLVLAGYEDPRKATGAHDLDLPFQRLLKSYRNADPVPKPQLALPVHTIATAGQHYQAPQAAVRATADLVITAFFFLLRVGEYTMPKKQQRTRTVQFRLQDVTFRRANNTIIQRNAPLAELAAAASVTLFLDNQKNGQRGTTVLHTATGNWFCPVQALARRVASIMTMHMPADTPLSFVRPGCHVSPMNVTNLVHHAAVATNLIDQGYSLQRIGTHSLRASGAMALKLQGAADSTIMKIGRWTGTTFLTYIHSQIGAINAGLATKMAVHIHFTNVGAIG
jgi:hypothetical protein